MRTGLLVCLAWLFGITSALAQSPTYRPEPDDRYPQQRYPGNRFEQLPVSPYVQTPPSPAQQAQDRALLQRQIEQWRLEARGIKAQLNQENLQQKPDTSELDQIALNYGDDITLLLLKQTRGPGDPWEKVYIGRGLLALLNRLSLDQLALQEKPLIQVFRTAPDFQRGLADPAVPFPQQPQGIEAEPPTPGPKDKSAAVEPSEEYLLALRQARLDAEQRQARDRQVALVNQAVAIFQRECADLLIRIPSPAANQAVVQRLNRQLLSKDATFPETIKALEQTNLVIFDSRMLSATRALLYSLSQRFQGPLPYTVYTEVNINEQTTSQFAQTELNFSELIEPFLTRLSEQIEIGSETATTEPAQKTPGPEARPPSARPSRERPLDSPRARQMKEVLRAILLYYSDRGDWPNRLDNLDRVEVFSANQLADIIRTYRYDKPSGRPAKNAGTAILFERTPSRPDGQLIGFGDGHLEFLSSTGN